MKRIDCLILALCASLWIVAMSDAELRRQESVRVQPIETGWSKAGTDLIPHTNGVTPEGFIGNLIGDLDLKSFPKIKTNQPIHWKLNDDSIADGQKWITNSEGRVFALVEAEASLEDVIHETPDGQKYTLFMAPRDRPADPPFPAWKRGQIFTNWFPSEQEAITLSTNVAPITLINLQNSGVSYLAVKRINANTMEFRSGDDSCGLFTVHNADKFDCSSTNNQAYLETRFEPVVHVLRSEEFPTRYEIRFRVK